MKKAKLTLALVAGLVGTIGLSSCNEVTYNEGVVLTYVDASGNRQNYTAKELLGEYEKGSGAASTSFDKVYELLIRNYYNGTKKDELNSINKEANNQVNGLKNQADENANSNGTTYQEEFEKILSSNGVDTESELFSLKQYEIEKERFEADFYYNNLETMRDGSVLETATAAEEAIWGKNDEGYLLSKMPYHVRHILVKVSAANGALTQGKITESEAKNLATVIKLLAGEGASETNPRQTFGAIAATYSEDGSNKIYGDLKIMDKDTSFVNEFKLGVFAYDALYNKTTTEYRTANKDRLLPTDTENTVLVGGVETPVKDVFTDGEEDDDGNRTGIGQIPYGAAIALLDAAEETGSKLAYKVNDGNEVFYPRNVLFNKYFNKHNVCVITPRDVDYNLRDGSSGTVAGTEVHDEKYNGVPSATYAALPGFQRDTTGIVELHTGENVLTNSEGQIVLAVRAGSSGSYEGVHFIVVDRSALDLYGSKLEDGKALTEVTTTAKEASGVYTENRANLSDYYNTYDPSNAKYPSYAIPDGLEKLTTFVNRWKQQSTEWKSRANEVVSAIKGYNSNMSSYIFEKLVLGEYGDGAKITFKDENVQKLVESYVKEKRVKTASDSENSWEETWKTYAEYLIHQEEIRKGNGKGTGELISETCAIGYLTADAQNETGVWAKGGACYGK
ncbi:MAG: hypothetical protein MJ239_00880 [Bacilli bacterium]|nr:hypothetical protein [Bacilli bacterium]